MFTQTLVECLVTACDRERGAWRQKTYPRDFFRRLRLGGKTDRKEHSAKKAV
jgi:hypothetical protein